MGVLYKNISKFTQACFFMICFLKLNTCMCIVQNKSYDHKGCIYLIKKYSKTVIFVKYYNNLTFKWSSFPSGLQVDTTPTID